MASPEEMARNRVAGDYQVLAELLGNGGRVALLPSVPFLPGRWAGSELTFPLIVSLFGPVPAGTTSVFLRTKTNTERISATPTAAGVISVDPVLFASPDVVEYVAFYDIDDKLTAFGSVRP